MSPPKPERPSPTTPRRSSVLTIIGLMLFAVVGGGTLLVLPTGFIGPVVVFGGFFFFVVIGFHYIVWGRWLRQILEEEQQRELDQE